MAAFENYLTVTEAAQSLGLTPRGVRTAIQEGRIKPVRLDKTSRTNLFHRDEVERYRRDHLGQRGKRKHKPAEPAE